MKGAKRILSVFLLVVTLCTFFVSPTNAISSFPSYSSFKRFNTSVLTMATGDLYFKPDDTSTFGTATVLLPIPSGKTYRLDMIGNFSIYSGSASLEISLFKSNPDNVVKVLYSGAVSFSRKTFNWEIDGSDDLYILIRMKGNCAFWWNSAGFVDRSTDAGILNSIKEGFNKLWEWLKGIWDSIKEIPTKIGQFITSLGDRISTFFSNLTNSIKGFFADLWDKIWNGDGSVPPFDNNNKFAQVIEKLNEWTAKIKEFSGSVDSSADTVTGYLQSGTSFLNSAMGAFPAALTAVLGFALVFIVVRKVVGR